MNVSSKGIALLKEFEGEELTAYVCPAGALTICYGSTGPHVKRGMKITVAEAEALLRKDLVRFEQAVAKSVKVPLTQNQYDALVCFAFNIGPDAFANSTLVRMLNNGNPTGASSQFIRWVKAGTKTLPGLVRRRQAEAALFRAQ